VRKHGSVYRNDVRGDGRVEPSPTADTDADGRCSDLVGILFARATERAEAAHEIAAAGQAGSLNQGASKVLAARLGRIAEELRDLATAIAVITSDDQ
jgi:hypothetical protein